MGTKAICPKCRAEIPLADINVAADTALCRRCGSAWHFGELLEENSLNVDLTRPPPGAWFRQLGSGFEVGASTRSTAAFFLVPFMCVWSGFSLGGIYGTQIVSGKFNWFMSLFGIPFILGTLLFGSIALMSVCGKVVVSQNRDEGTIFTGVGPFGWRRQFNWNGITAIRRTVKYGNRGAASDQITIEGEKRLNFASSMNAMRLDFMLAALQQKLRENTH